jgi:8-oxo-dGTP diphosphatase
VGHAEHAIELIARGVCVASGHVLVAESVEGGFAYLPGGHVEFGERAAAALAREMMEESGIAVAVGRLMLVHEHRFDSGREHHEMNLVFHVEHGRSHRHPWPSLEPTVRFTWHPLEHLVGLDLRPRTVRDWLLRRLASTGREVVDWISDIPRDGTAGG